MPAPLDLTSETPLSLAAAARRIPPLRGTRPVHPATVLRWVLDGTRLPDGSRLRLEAVRCGGAWITTAEAIDRYLSALTSAPLAGRGTPTPPPRTPGQRRRASERAAERLSAAGI
jgi:hypothetical protein